MVLGLSTSTFTLIHVLISLAGLGTGMVVLFGMLLGRRLAGWTGWFLITTVATSVTGFLFHSAKFGPPHVVGVISLVTLALSILALYGYGAAGRWRGVYVVTALLALYLNVFVAVVQAFGKLPALHALAPTGSEPAFIVAQALVLLAFVILTVLALRRFHPVSRVPG